MYKEDESDLIRQNVQMSLFDIKKGIILPTKITDDLAYLCVVMAGDGHIVKMGKTDQNQIFCVGIHKTKENSMMI